VRRLRRCRGMRVFGVLMGRRWLVVLLVCAVMVLRLLPLPLLLAKRVTVGLALDCLFCSLEKVFALSLQWYYFMLQDLNSIDCWFTSALTEFHHV